jgi:hypothetical protein
MGSTIGRRLRHDLELHDSLRLLPMTGAQAVRPGITAADDHHGFTSGQNSLIFVGAIPLVPMILLGQELHGEVDTPKLAAGYEEIARLLGASGQEDSVKVVPEVVNRDVPANVCPGDEFHPFGGHLLEAAIDHVLLKLEVRDTIPQQTADAVSLFEDCHRVAGAT